MQLRATLPPKLAEFDPEDIWRKADLVQLEDKEMSVPSLVSVYT